MRKILCAMLIFAVTASPLMAMTDEQKEKCHYIIHSSATAAAGSAAVLSQLPGADNVALAMIVGTMAVSLAQVFDKGIEGVKDAALTGGTILILFSGVITTRTVSQWLVGWIPFAGNAVNAASMFALVEFIGWELAEKYDSGDFDTLKTEK